MSTSLLQKLRSLALLLTEAETGSEAGFDTLCEQAAEYIEVLENNLKSLAASAHMDLEIRDERIKALEAEVKWHVEHADKFQDGAARMLRTITALDERVHTLEAALRKLLELEEVWYPGNRTGVRAKLVKDIARQALEAKE